MINLMEFRVLQPVPHPSVAGVLKHCIPTEAARDMRWTEFPRGASIRIHANGNGYRPMTFLHRNAAGRFQLIRRLVTRCTRCGGEKVMFVYPDGIATCGVCEMERN